MGRRILLIVLLIVLVAIIVLTWGSIASGAIALGLILGLAGLARRRFLESHDPEDYGS